MFKIGLIINPVAGIGGAVGLKGSDGEDIQHLAAERGAKPRSPFRTAMALNEVLDWRDKIVIYAGPGKMGEDTADNLGFETVIVGSTDDVTTGKDTERIAGEMASLNLDYIMFSGGDGTARNICTALDAVKSKIPVIGVPAGVKIHSGVYATSPSAAGKALLACLRGNIVFQAAEVMDLDEEKYRQGCVHTRLYGYLNVPTIRNVIQNPKAASHNSDHDVEGICEEIRERIINERKKGENNCYIFGAGSTVQKIMDYLGYESTLIGVDVVENDLMLVRDATERQLIDLTRDKNCRLIITAIGGQGHIFGRGNQQLSPEVIRNIGLDNIWIVAAASKIHSLPGHRLFVDTGDQDLNEALQGYRKVVVGWQEMLVCKVS